MDQTSGSNSKSWKRQLLIAKLLLKNYGMLHELQVRQLECYLIACCPTSLDGTVEIDAEAKSVIYQIFTKRFFRLKEKKLAPRHKWEVKVSHMFGKKAYAEEAALAAVNLNTWTKELLWEDETKVKVFIDGRPVEQKSN